MIVPVVRMFYPAPTPLCSPRAKSKNSSPTFLVSQLGFLSSLILHFAGSFPPIPRRSPPVGATLSNLAPLCGHRPLHDYNYLSLIRRRVLYICIYIYIYIFFCSFFFFSTLNLSQQEVLFPKYISTLDFLIIHQYNAPLFRMPLVVVVVFFFFSLTL